MEVFCRYLVILNLDMLYRSYILSITFAPSCSVSANIYLPAESQDGSKMSEEIKGLRRELNKEIERNEKLQNQLDAEKKMKENYGSMFSI